MLQKEQLAETLTCSVQIRLLARPRWHHPHRGLADGGPLLIIARAGCTITTGRLEKVGGSYHLVLMKLKFE